MSRPLARRRCLVAARLTVVFAVLGAALVLPGAASAATNPGTVELFHGSLNYTARAGETNHIVASFEPDLVTLTDTDATLNAGAGCHPGSSVREVLCTTEDVGTSAFYDLRYVIDAGDLDDSVNVTTADGEEGASVFLRGTLYGRAGADTLTGSNGGDVLVGGSGADALSGGAGSGDVVSYADHALGITAAIGGNGGNSTDGAGDTIATDVETLAGGPGADILTGNAAYNSLVGAGGDDVLHGAGGDDLLSGDGSPVGFTTDQSDPPATADGDDELHGGAGMDYMQGGAGADAFNGDGGDDSVDYNDHGSTGVTVTIGGGGGNSTDGTGDTIAADVEAVRGGSGADTLNGDGASNRLDGGQGADTLNGNDGADTLFPGLEGIFGYPASPDTINGGDGNDVLTALGSWQGSSDGAETFNGGAGIDRADYSSYQSAVTVTLNNDAADDGAINEHDRIGSDVEEVTGGAGGDTITGNDAANRLHGGHGGGADVITGGGGDDRLYGGYGVGSGGTSDGADTLEGEAGDDTLISRDGATDTVVDCGTGDGDSVHPDSTPPDNPLGCEDNVAAGESGPVSAGQVTLSRTGLIYTARSGEENDVTATFSAEQAVLTDPGAVQLEAGPGCRLDDSVTVRCGREDIGFTSSNYTIHTGDGDDRVQVVSAGDGELDGGSGDDELVGGAGTDLIDGGTGGDTLSGGEGTDTVTYADHTVGVDATIGAGATSSEDGTGDSISADFENLVGGPADDTLTGDGGDNSLTGGYGADTLRGMGGGDELEGFRSTGGFVTANDGGDTLEGGAGSDRLRGGAGPDAFSGGDGSDTVGYTDHYGDWRDYDTDTQMDAAPVTVTIGAGDDDDGNAMDGPDGARDTVAVDVENLEGSILGDTLTGSAAPNRINGHGGADTIAGLGGNDVLRAGFDQSADTLDGGDGADSYLADGFYDYNVSDEDSLPDGADTFTGGAGTDKVDYSGRTMPVTVTLDGIAADGQAGELDDIGPDVENVTGGSHDDTLTGNERANRLHGGPGTGSDTLDGAAGDDRIIGGNGSRSGSDDAAGDGADSVLGGSGHDTVSSTDLRVDTVDCGDGIDVVNADAGEPEEQGGPATAVDDLSGCESINPTGFTQAISAGGTVTSDSQPGDVPGVSAADPVDVAITSPDGGNVTVVESEVTGSQPPPGSDYLALQVNITAPVATEAVPLRLVFTVDSSLVPAAGASAIKVYRDGAQLDEGCPTPTTASAAGCVLSRTTDGGDVTLTILTAHASAWNFAVAKAAVTPPSGGGGTTPTPPPVVTTPKPPLNWAQIRDAVRLILKFVTAPHLKVQEAIKHGGLYAKFSCSKACDVTADLRLTGRDARRLGLPRVIGSGKAKRRGRGNSRVVVSLTARAQRRLLRIDGSVIAALTLKTTDAAGNRATAGARRITLRR